MSAFPMRTAALLIVLVTLESAAQEEPEDETAKDIAALKGKWQIISSDFEGKDATATYRATVIVIDGDKLYFTDGFVQSAATKFKLDAKTKPRSIDIGGDKEKEKVVKGIYELDKDSLKLCLSPERPKEFKTKPGDKTNLFVLKRQKP